MCPLFASRNGAYFTLHSLLRSYDTFVIVAIDRSILRYGPYSRGCMSQTRENARMTVSFLIWQKSMAKKWIAKIA
jgi:hypothetical protein